MRRTLLVLLLQSAHACKLRGSKASQGTFRVLTNLSVCRIGLRGGSVCQCDLVCCGVLHPEAHISNTMMACLQSNTTLTHSSVSGLCLRTATYRNPSGWAQLSTSQESGVLIGGCVP